MLKVYLVEPSQVEDATCIDHTQTPPAPPPMNSILPVSTAFNFNADAANESGLAAQVMSDVTQLGCLLLNQNLISAAQLQTTLMTQAICGVRLGDLLLEAKLISAEQLERALREQAIRRQGHWVI